MNPTFFSSVLFLTNNLKNIVVSLLWNVTPTGLYVVVILVVSFAVHIGLFIVVTVIPVVVFAVPTFES